MLSFIIERILIIIIFVQFQDGMNVVKESEDFKKYLAIILAIGNVLNRFFLIVLQLIFLNSLRQNVHELCATVHKL